VSARALLITLAIVLCGAGAIIPVLASQAGGRPALTAYETDIREVFERHNAISGRWNEFLDEFNSAEQDAVPEFYERFEKAADLTASLAVDSQSVITEWKRIVPPPDYEPAHRLALTAFQGTQEAFLTFGDYFQRTVDEGFPPDELMSEGTTRLDEVSRIWEQVRAASP